jgi:hypothetical protein
MKPKIKTEQELNIELKNLKDIYINVRILHDDCKYLSNPKTEQENEIKRGYIIFQSIIFSMWRLTIIELCKLFGKPNDDYQIESFLKNILEDFEILDYKDKIEKDRIVDWLNTISNNVDLKNLIKKIQTLRDKYFAHSDRNRVKSIHEFTLTKIEFDQLFSFIENILKYFESNIYGRSISFDISNVGNASNILNDLVDYKKLKWEKHRNAIKEQNK